MFRRVLLSTVAATALAASALAADLPSRRPPPQMYVPPPPIFTWSGFYVGVNAGAAFRADNNNGFNNAVFAFGGAAPFIPGFLGTTNNNTSNLHFIGGGQAGFNWQINQFVLGVEADGQALGRSNNNAFGGFGNNGGSSVSFLGTARARLGVAFDRFLVYGTGGLAYGNTGWPNTVFGLNGAGAPALFTNFGSSSNIRLGYVAGAGVEYAFTRNFTAKVEYLYTDLGRTTRTYFDPTTGGGFAFSNRERNHIIRAGLNYKFDWWGVPAPVLARY
jgi:outer membrane immunogenic protein